MHRWKCSARPQGFEKMADVVGILLGRQIFVPGSLNNFIPVFIGPVRKKVSLPACGMYRQVTSAAIVV